MTDQKKTTSAGQGNSSNAEVTYLWPDWNKELGDPPQLVIQGEVSEAYLVAINHVLSNISEMSRKQNADALKAQLTALSAISINIHPASSEESADWKPRTEAPKKFDQPPYIHYSPHVWGRYPVKDAQELEASSFKLPDFSKTGMDLFRSAREPALYSEYGIAPPEQILLHELGHYVHFDQAHQLFIKSHDANQNPFNPDPNTYYHQAMRLIKKGSDESYIIDHYENPAMKSVTSDFKERDAEHHSDAISMLEGKNGMPAVKDAERQALENALKLHPVRDLLQHEDQGKIPTKSKKDTPDESVSIAPLLRQNNLELVAAEASKLPAIQRIAVLKQIASNANDNGIFIDEKAYEKLQVITV